MSIKYYIPNKGLVEYLQQELHNLQYKTEKENTVGENTKYIRKPETRNRTAKKKFHYMDHIFQSFTDIIFFLEFIEQNYAKLHDIFDDDLKQLFGYFDDHAPNKYQEKPSSWGNNDVHHSNPPLKRFVEALLLLNTNVQTYPPDFRTFLLVILIDKSLQALYDRFSGDEKYMVSDDCRRTRFWAKFLEKQSIDKAGLSNKRIASFPYKTITN